VRLDLYGADEKRTLADFRRSGGIEAVAGEAPATALAQTMGNTLDRCHDLFRTYCPVNVVSLDIVARPGSAGRSGWPKHKPWSRCATAPAQLAPHRTRRGLKCLK
jgi:hypothetical protein